MPTAALTTDVRPNKILSIALWVAQALLAFAFGASGAMKLTSPEAFVRLPTALTYFIGAVEVLGAIGILVPAITRIAPKLTPLAALGFLVIMVLGAGAHAMWGEYSSIPVNVVLGGLAFFVAWGRWKKAPIAPRS
jgi:putative oxidoreductase